VHPGHRREDNLLAKPNYQFEKRRKELEKKRKKEEKKRRKLAGSERRDDGEGQPSPPGSDLQ
jgi:hypothetical protein